MDQQAVDMHYMQQALLCARGGMGYVSPNPLVGCLVVKDGAVIGQGYHQYFGGPHAEVYALQAAGSQAQGATLYVTLEPCCHTGKTPPCVDAVLRSGVQRVVVAMRDPNPKVDGGGLARLQAAGIAMTQGVCEAEAKKLNESFLKHITTGLPFVVLKSAMTLDGKIATRTGASRWITGALAREEVHRLRHAYDAIMVGIGTVLQDDPQLTTRLPEQKGVNPLRIIVDSTLRVPHKACVTEVDADCRTLIATTERAAMAPQEALQARGVEVVRLPADEDGTVNLEALLRYLGGRGVASILVEGGARLTATLIRRRLLDKLLVFLAPKIIGGDGISWVAPWGVDTMDQVACFQHVTGHKIGEDFLLEAYPA